MIVSLRDIKGFGEEIKAFELGPAGKAFAVCDGETFPASELQEVAHSEGTHGVSGKAFVRIRDCVYMGKYNAPFRQYFI